MRATSTVLWRPARAVLWGCVLCGALVGLLGGQRPTGLVGVDIVLVSAFGAALVVAASRAHRWATLLAAAPATLLIDAPAGWAGLGVTVVVSVAVGYAPPEFRHSRWRHTAGGLAGLGLVVTYGNLSDGAFAHSSALVAGCGAALVMWSGWTCAPRSFRHRWRWVALGAVSVVAVFGALAAFGAAQSRSHARAAERHLSDAVEHARAGDRDQLETALGQAHSELSRARDWIDAPWQLPARLIPIASQNLRATSDTLELVDEVVRTLEPAARLAELDGLRFADGRVDLDAVATLADQLRPSATAVTRTITFASADQSAWLASPVTDGLARLTASLDRFGGDLVKASHALDALPDMLGANGPRRYLVLFVTPSESRGGGGFPGQTAELTFDQGAFTLGAQYRSPDITAPEGTSWNIEGADEYLQRYGTFRVASAWQNITMSPDFPTAAAVAQQAYQQFASTQIDGVIRVGPRAFAGLLAITGPVRVTGLDEPLDAQNAVSFFTRDQYDDAFLTNDDRVVFLERFVEQVVDGLTGLSITDPRSISDAFGPAILAGDLAMWSANTDAQSALASLGLDASVPDASDSDTLFVTQHNLLPNKVDAYSTRTIVYDITVDRATGQMNGTLEVSLANGAPTDLPDYVIGTGTSGLPRGSMRELLTIYSPHVLTDFEVNGQPVDLLLQTELGRFAYQVQVEVQPGETATITAAVAGSTSWPYRLVLPAIPAVNHDSVSVRVNGGPTTTTTMDRARVVSP